MARNSILGVFAKSPIKPLENHIRIVVKCCKQLVPFVDACYAEDWAAATKIRAKISKYEKEADALKRKIRLELPGGLFMPVDRADLLELLTQQDKIANRTKDIAGRILGRKMVFPEVIRPALLAFVDRSIDASVKAAEAVNELDDLLETGFRGREVELVEKIIVELGNIEDDTDDMQIKIRRALFKIEKDFHPVDVMFLYQIIEWVGDLADLSERVGARLEILLARK